MRPQIKTADDAVEWMTECTLATIEHLVALKRQSKSEIQRQINIAQVGVDYIKGVDRPRNHRIRDVLRRHDGDVLSWAKSS